MKKRLCDVWYTLQDVCLPDDDFKEVEELMGKKNRYVDQYEGAWRPDDMDAMDEKFIEAEEAEEMSGMRIFDPTWSDAFIDEIANIYDEAISEGMTEEEALEEAAAQTGYTSDEIRSILEEGSARLQNSIPE